MISQQITDSCVAEFSKMESTWMHNEDVPSWLKILKKDAIRHFSLHGFPTIRQEDWKYTPLSSLVNNRFIVASAPSPALKQAVKSKLASCIIDPTWPRLVFVNGYVILEWSMIVPNMVGLQFRRLTDSLRDQFHSFYDQDFNMTNLAPWFQSQPLTALNTALFFEGACISIAANTHLDLPLHLIFIQSQDYEHKVMMFPRNQIHLGANSQAKVIESHISLVSEEHEMSTALIDSVTQMKLEENAQLDYFRTHESTCPSHHFATAYTTLGRNSRFNSFSLVFNTSFSRDYSFVDHEGEESESQLWGLYCLGSNHFADQLTIVEHSKPHSKSQQLFKSILAGSAQGYFSGKIIAHKHAQKTDAKQLNKNLLLSDSATAYTKPHLEINADDVKCSHGASVGSLDKNALFYFRTRGIQEKDSQYLLAQGFAEEIISKIQLIPLRKAIENSLKVFLHSTFQNVT